MGGNHSLMLPSVFLDSLQVVVTDCPVLVAPAPPEHWFHSGQRVVHDIKFQTMSIEHFSK